MSRNATAYDADFMAWTFEQAKLLRDGQLTRIDAANIAEELESMGRSERRELRSRLVVLTAHLLKWQYQPEHRSRSWRSTINVQRRDLAKLLEDSPSLRRELRETLERYYPEAVDATVEETTIFKKNFPAACPYAPEAILDETFFPGEPA